MSGWLIAEMRPAPDAVRAARLTAGLTQTAAGELCHRALRAWQAAESGTRNLDAAAWELFLLRTGQHPADRLVARKRRTTTSSGQAG